MFGFVMFFGWLGFGGEFVFSEMTRQAPAGEYHHVYPWFTIGMTVGGIAAVAYAWATGPRKVLWSTGARRVDEPTTPEEKQLANVVEEMAIASGLPVPEIYVVA